MVNPTTIHKIKPSLNDMVYCANCSAAMAQTGQNYYCPNNSTDSRRNCTTKPVPRRPPAIHRHQRVVEQVNHG